MKSNGKKTILLVEDEAIIAINEKMSLENLGYEVITANTGEKAIKTFETNPGIDLVLMDIDLGSGIDGTETAEIILKKKDIPIVFLSSHIEPEIVEKTEKMTSYGYVVKDTGETVLDASIKMAFKLFNTKIKEQAKERALQKNENEYMSMLNDLLTGFIVHGSDTGILFANTKASEILGLTVDQMIGKKAVDPSWNFVHEDFTPLKIDEYPVSRVLSTGKPFTDNVFGIKRPDREYITWIIVNAIPVFSENKELEKVTVNFIDITDRKKAEDSLKTANEINENIISSSPIGISIYNSDGCCVSANDAMGNVIGATKKQVLQQNYNQIESWKISGLYDVALCAMQENKKMRHEIAGKSTFGKMCRLDCYLVPFSIGGKSHLLLMIEDNTERRQAEEELRESEQFLNRVINENPFPIWIGDNKGTIIKCNKALLDLLQLEEDQLVGKYNILKDPLIQHLKEGIRKIFDKGENWKFEVQWEAQPSVGVDSSHVVIAGEVFPIFNNKGEITNIVATYHDITALRKSEETFKAIVEHVPVMIDSFDENNRCTIWNKELIKQLGYTKAEVNQADNPLELFYSKNEAEKVVENILRKDGKFRVFHPTAKNGEKKIQEWADFALPDGQGVSIGMDITERKQAEEKIQKLLEEKEMLLKEVHHRIKNNMNVMRSLFSLQSQSLDIPEAVSALQDAIARIDSMRLLYDKLYRSESYQDVSVKEYLPHLIREIYEMFPERKKIKIETQIEDFTIEPKIIFPLGIIINELLTNAMKYAFAGMDSGLIQISGVLKKKRVTIIFKDNGVGMPEKNVEEGLKGFGITLIGLLTEQINGSYKIEIDNGTRYIIEFDI